MKQITFEDLVIELNRPLTAYLNKMTGNPIEADDLLQETMIRIAKGLSHYEGRSNIKTWAYRIATNTAIDYFRKSKKRRYVEFSETDEYIDEDMEDTIVVQEMNECIRKVVNEMPPDYRAVLLLTNFEGKSIRKVSEICDLSISATKVRVHRAKKRLQEALDNKCNYYTGPDGSFRCIEKE